MNTKLKKTCALLLAAVQVLSPMAATAATHYEYLKRVPTLTVTSGTTTSPTPSGSGTPPAVPGAALAVVSALSVDAGNVTVGSTAARTVRLTNEGTATLTLSSQPAVSGAAFSATSNCTGSLAVGAYCDITVSFAPQVEGAASGTLSLATNAAGSPVTVALAGVGVTSTQVALSTGYQAVVTPTGSFGSVDVGGSSDMLVYVLAASGTYGHLSVGAALAGDSQFKIVSALKDQTYQYGAGYWNELTTGCGAAVTDTSVANCNSDDLATGAYDKVVLRLRYTPTSAAPTAPTTLSVSHNGYNTSPLTLSLSGAGRAALASTSATTLDFGTVNSGDTTAVKAVQLNNTGNGPMTISGQTLGGTNPEMYAAATACGSTLAAGSSCVTNVTFAPTAVGSLPATLNYVTSGGNVTVSLTGMGASVTQSGALTAGASNAVVTLYSGTVPLSNAASLKLLSGSTVVATIPAVTWSPASSTLTGTVATTPAAGTYTAQVLDAAGAVIATAQVTTINVTGSLAADSGYSVAFGTVVLGATKTQTFKFSNPSSVALTGVYAAVSGNAYASVTSNTCGLSGAKVTVAAGGTCLVSVAYSPTAVDSMAATLSVYSTNATNSPSTLSLTGQGVTSFVALNFNDGNNSTTFTDSGNSASSWAAVGSATESTTYYREGTGALALNGSTQALVGPPISLTGDFTVSAWIRPTTISASYNPIMGQWNQSGTKGGWLLSMNSTGNLVFGMYSYHSSNPVVTSSTAVTAGQWAHVAATRAGSTFTLYINGVSVGTASFAGAGPTLADVNTTIGNYYNSSGTLGAAGTAWFNGSIDSVYINKGMAVAPSAPLRSVLQETTTDFSTVTLGTASSTVNVPVKNNGSTPVTVVSAASTGSSEFSVISAAACTGATLAPGATCNVTMKVTASSAGARTGTLTVTTGDASNSPLAVGLTAYAAFPAAALDINFQNGATNQANSAALTANGTVSSSSTTGYATGFSDSAYFGGNTATADTSIGTSTDFTMEGWFYLNALPTASGSGSYFTIFRGDNASSMDFGIVRTGIKYALQPGNGTKQFTYTFPTKQWFHVAIVRQSGTSALFVNGVKQGTTVADTQAYLSSSPFRLGANSATGMSMQFNGNIGSFKLTKSALYGTSFTPVGSPANLNLSVNSATYGSVVVTPSLVGNLTTKLKAYCDGTASCTFQPLSVYGSDPQGGTAKPFVADYSCSANSGRSYVPAEAGVTNQNLACSTLVASLGTVTVNSASYGANQGGTGNMTAKLKSACDGKRVCDFGAVELYGSDPYPSKSKDLQVSYTCSTGATKSISLAAGTSNLDYLKNSLTCP